LINYTILDKYHFI